MNNYIPRKSMHRIIYPCPNLSYPDSKVHGANMGPIEDRQDPGGPHVGPRNLAIWVVFVKGAPGLLIWKLQECAGIVLWLSVLSCQLFRLKGLYNRDKNAFTIITTDVDRAVREAKHWLVKGSRCIPSIIYMPILFVLDNCIWTVAKPLPC